ncbi:MAG: ATP-binding protein [Ignavibacteria bacterium]|nr:ATP-binding protein [Ignavibacteria bacterium]
MYDLALDARMIAYERDTDKDPTLVSVRRLYIAHTLKKCGDHELALLWYKSCRDVASAHELRDIFSNIAEQYLALRQHDSALAYLSRAYAATLPNAYGDINGRAWNWFAKARCYAGLNSNGVLRALDSATVLLEKQRTSKNRSDVAVRMSIIKAVLEDSVLAARIGPQRSAFVHRLSSIYQADSATSVVLGLREAKIRPKVREPRSLILPVSGDQKKRHVDSLNGMVITGSALDSKGWRWLSTLDGLYLNTGRLMINVDQTDASTSCRAGRSVRIVRDAILVDRYSGQTDTIDRDRLVRHMDGAALVRRREPTYELIAWHGQTPTALIGSASSENVLWCFDSKIGWGTLRSRPSLTKDIVTEDGTPWSAKILCGLIIGDSVALLGTDKGLWQIRRDETTAHRMRGQPQDLMHEQVFALTIHQDSDLVIHPIIDASSTVRLDRDGSIRWRSFRRLYTVGQFPWEREGTSSPRFQTVATVDPHSSLGPPVRSAVAYPSISILYDPVRPLVVSDDLIVDLNDATLQVVDLTNQRADVHLLPFDVTNGMPQRVAGFTSGSRVGVITQRGLLLIDLTRQRTADGTSFYATRRRQDAWFTIWSDQCSIDLSVDERSVELVVGRPAHYGSSTTPTWMILPWNDQLLSFKTGTLVPLEPSSSGVHRIHVIADDRTHGEIIEINMEPRLTETWWFWTLLSVMTALLGYISYRYSVTLMHKRRLEREQIAFVERVQIGQDLHDAIGADIVRINMLVKGQASDSTNAEVGRVTREASRTLRDIIWSVSDRHDLDAAIAILAERCRAIADEAGIMCHVDLPLLFFALSLPPQTLRDITLIVTEALTNIIKHAGATEIRFVVTSTSEKTTITVIDNGRGFSGTPAATGIGLTSMRHRAQRSGLILNVNSSIGSGTTISLTISS